MNMGYIKNGLICNNYNDKNSFLFVSFFFVPIINGYINEIFLVFGIQSISVYSYVLIYLLSLYIYFWSFFKYYNRIFSLFILLFLFFMFEIMYYPDVSDAVFDFSNSLSSIAVSKFFVILFLCLPILWISLCLNEYCIEYVLKYCKIFSYITIVLYIITMILQCTSPYVFNYMTIAYNVMPSLMVLIYCGFVEKKILAKIFFILGVALIFIGGCRGALLQVIIAMILFYFLNFMSSFTPKRLIYIFIGIIITIILYKNFYNIMLLVDEILKSLGYSSRLIRMFLNTTREGGILHFEDRSEIYAITIPLISIWGNGILVFPYRTMYPHNIIIEFLLNFGYIGGSLLIFRLFKIIYMSYCCVKHSDNHFEIVIWIFAFTTIFVKLMLSSSYLTDRTFWFSLSFMIFFIRINREKDNDKIYCKKNNLFIL